jgi:hypothetical protein
MAHSLSLLYSNKHKEEIYHVPSRGIAYEKAIFELTEAQRHQLPMQLANDAKPLSYTY